MSVPSRLSLPVRVVLSIVIVWHLLAMVGSGLQHVMGQGLRQYTRPYEQSLGVHQTWPMFVGAPRRTRWLTFVGVLADGSEIPLPGLRGEPDPDGVIWRYDRRHKFERNATSTRREYLRTALVRWQCRRAAAEGLPLRKVGVVRMTQPTPPPGSGVSPRETWPVESTELGRWNCPR